MLAGVTGISSSAIASKLLIELGRLGNREAPLIFGIILIEDLFLAFYLALLAPVIGGAEGAGETLIAMGTSFAFLLTLAAVARWGADWVANLIDDRDDELLIVSFTGLAVLSAGVAEHLGVSDAIGALMMGLIVGCEPDRRAGQGLRPPAARCLRRDLLLRLRPGDQPRRDRFRRPADRAGGGDDRGPQRRRRRHRGAPAWARS